MYITWFNAESLLLALRQDPEVARLAALYLRWVSMGLPGMNATFSEILNIDSGKAYAFNCVSRYVLSYSPVRKDRLIWAIADVTFSLKVCVLCRTMFNSRLIEDCLINKVASPFRRRLFCLSHQLTSFSITFSVRLSY